jgi:hypothetical protein
VNLPRFGGRLLTPAPLGKAGFCVG